VPDSHAGGLGTELGPALLWYYEGIAPAPAVAPPSQQAIDLVHDLAAGIWADPLTAYERSEGFGELEADDLLGLLAHMPAPRDPSWQRIGREHPLYWQRFAQVWVCVGILHHRPQELWRKSARRTLLLRLLYGPDDWTVDAAAFALCVSAWRFPTQRADVAEAVARRYLHAVKAVGRRPTQLHDPLARIVLICPGVEPKIARQARKALTERREIAEAGDVEQLKDSLLRRWKRHKRS
jgi:hypothetical protein